MGLEPTTFCMASRRSSQLSYTRVSVGNHTRGLLPVLHQFSDGLGMHVLHDANSSQ